MHHTTAAAALMTGYNVPIAGHCAGCKAYKALMWDLSRL